MIQARKWLALFVAITAIAISAQAQDSQESRLLRFPDIYKDKVAFVYGGDIWLASASGVSPGGSRRILGASCFLSSLPTASGSHSPASMTETSTSMSCPRKADSPAS